MDPQATWDQLLSALADGDWDRAHELVSALADWLARDGFPPTVLGIAALGPEFDRALAQAACDFIHSAIADRSSAVPSKGAKS